MKTFVGVLSLVLVGTAVAQHQSASQGRPGADVLPDKKQTVEALNLLFEDPATGEKPKPGYKAYLKWQKERAEVALKIAAADDQSEKLSLARDMRDLDKNFRIRYGEVLETLEVLYFAENYYFPDQAALDKVGTHDKKAFDAYMLERKAVAEKIDTESKIDMKRHYAQVLGQLDHAFKLKYLGFQMGLKKKGK